MRSLRIGTSGWQYRDWRATFYPPGLAQHDWLRYYAQRFPSVEVNSTFYGLPDPAVFTRWAEATPAAFRFALKASRYLTHVRRLREPEEPVRHLLDAARGLGDRLAVVLVQLPPNMLAAPDRLAETLASFPSGVRVAVEPRHASWFDDEVYALLREHDAALCFADRRSRVSPLVVTASWCYVRLHEGRAGPGYGPKALDGWVDRLRRLLGDRPDGYVFFDNDTNACAVRDAESFTRRCLRAGFAAAHPPT